MPLGRFLEISLGAPDVAVSLAFYESLGFEQVPVGEAWPHPYGVVTDGRLCLGLHQADFSGAMLTWVAPELRQRLDTLAACGITIEQSRLDDGALNELRFSDPGGQSVRLIEARTFSPPVFGSAPRSALGYFEEMAIPADDLVASTVFWERFGFVAFPDSDGPADRVLATSRDLNLGLRHLPGPMLVFSDPDMPARIGVLRDKGYSFARRPGTGLGPGDAAILHAPEGTALLLVTDRDE